MLTDDHRQRVETLFRRYAKGVGSYVLARVGNADVAETITGAVFLTVVERLDQCRGSIVAWLWSIVRSEIARYFRDRKGTTGLDADLLDGSAGPRSKAEQSEEAARLRRALAGLTEEQRSLVYMKFFLDLRNTEIAEALDMSPSHVGVVAHRAVKRLRELMESPTPKQVGVAEADTWPAGDVLPAMPVLSR